MGEIADRTYELIYLGSGGLPSVPQPSQGEDMDMLTTVLATIMDGEQVAIPCRIELTSDSLRYPLLPYHCLLASITVLAISSPFARVAHLLACMFLTSHRLFSDLHATHPLSLRTIDTNLSDAIVSCSLEYTVYCGLLNLSVRRLRNA
jgi:hypothetical protein